MPVGIDQETSGKPEPGTTKSPNGLWLGVYTVALLGIGQGAALFTLLLISRSMQEVAFGQFSSSLAIQNYVVLIGTLGLRTIVTRDLARNPERIGSIWGTLWLMTGPIGIGVAVSGHFLSGLLFSRSVEEVWMSMWLSLGVCFSIISVVPLLDALGRQRLALTGVAITEILFLFSLIGGWIPLKIEVVGAAFAIKWIIAALIQAVFLHISSGPIRWSFDKEQAVQWSKSAPPLLLTSIVMTIPITGAVILARCFLGEAESAVIGLAGQLAGAILLVGGVAVRFIQPRWRDTQSLYDRETQKFVIQFGLYGLIVWLGCLIVGSYAICVWLPSAYCDELFSIQLMLLAGGLGVVARVLWIALLAANRERDVMIAYACGCGVFLLFAFSLLPSLGSTGVAVAAAVGTLATVICMWSILRPLFKKAETLSLK